MNIVFSSKDEMRNVKYIVKSRMFTKSQMSVKINYRCTISGVYCTTIVTILISNDNNDSITMNNI